MASTLTEVLAALRAFHGAVPSSDVPSSGAASAWREAPADAPDCLLDVYRYVADVTRETNAAIPYGEQDHLLPPRRLKRVDRQIEFAWENQGNWSARFRPGLPDPPVLSNVADVTAAPAKGFVHVCDTLSHFLATFILQEAIFGATHVVGLPDDVTADTWPALRFASLWLHGTYVEHPPTHDFWLSDDGGVLLFRHRHEGVYAATHAASHASTLLAFDGARSLR